jgi:hypothetical protein
MKKQIFSIILCIFFWSGLLAQQADHKQSISIIPDSCEFITLYDANDFNLKGSELFLNWYGDPYIIKGNTIAALLPDFVFNIFELPDKSSPSQMICTENGITYLKHKNLIQIMEEDSIRTLFKMKDDKFQISLIADYLLYITTYTKDSSTVFIFDVGGSQIMKLFTVAGKINTIAGNGLNTYIAMRGELFLLSDNDIFKLMNIEQDITTLAWTEYGLFFSTTTHIGYILNQYQPFPFITKPAKKLLPWDNQMYIQFEDGTISILFGLEYFEHFVNSVYNN